MKKIFLVIPTLQQGGAERVISELANYFSMVGIQVHLVLLAEADDFYSVDALVTVHKLGFTNRGKLRKVQAELKALVQFRSLVKEHKPDAILSFMDKYNVFTIIASRFLNTRVFVSDRSNPKKSLPVSIKILKKLTYRYATGVIAQTSLAKSMVEKFTGNKNVKVIANPVKNIQLYPDVHKEKIILNVGRLVTEKGQSYLIQAFARLPDNDWSLVVLGEGPLRGNLEKLVAKLNLENRVLMPGSVSDVDAWLARASVFAFSSVSEGFPNGLVEAMAAGLPCVSFDCDTGPRDIIVDGVNGFLVEQTNVAMLADKIFTLMCDSELAHRIGLEAKEVRKTFDIEAIGNEYFNFMLESK